MKIFETIKVDALSPFKTICPSCKNEAKLSHLQFSDIDDDTREKLDSHDWKAIPRLMKKEQYEIFASKLEPFYEGQPTSKFIATIARIESHKIGYFKAHCELSNRFFKIYHHVLFNHKEKTAGATSLIDEEVRYDDKSNNKPKEKRYGVPATPESFKLFKELDELMENGGHEGKLSMKQIAELAIKFPTDPSYQNVKSPEEFYFGYRALSKAMIGEYEKSIDLCNEGLKINPESPYLYYLKGRTEGDCGMLKEGAEDLQKAIALKEDYADAYAELGHIHLKAGNQEYAQKCFDVARAIEPDIGLPKL